MITKWSCSIKIRGLYGHTELTGNIVPIMMATIISNYTLHLLTITYNAFHKQIKNIFCPQWYTDRHKRYKNTNYMSENKSN